MAVIRIRLVALLGFALVAAALLWSDIAAHGDLSNLNSRGTSTAATVTALSSKGKRVTYQFTISSGDYTRTWDDGGGFGNPDFSSLRVGDSITVVYLPESPKVSTPGDPQIRLVQLEGQVGLTIGLLFLVGIAIIYAYFFVGGRRGVASWRR